MNHPNKTNINEFVDNKLKAVLRWIYGSIITSAVFWILNLFGSISALEPIFLPFIVVFCILGIVAMVWGIGTKMKGYITNKINLYRDMPTVGTIAFTLYYQSFFEEMCLRYCFDVLCVYIIIRYLSKIQQADLKTSADNSR